MTIDDKIKAEKLQYHINREAAKISALLSGKIDKYEYLTGEEMLPSDQSRIIEKVKFTYSPLSGTFEKQIKTIEEQEKKQVKALKVLKPEKNQELKTIEGLFQKRKNEIMKLKINQMKLKNGKKKLNEKT